jgi:hypothetical protein
MTKPNPPTPRTGNDRLARDGAKRLEQRRTPRKLVLWTAALALLVAAARYLTCGHGFGLGGVGSGDDTGASTVQPAAGPQRCEIRITARGITVGGKPMQRDAVVAACRAMDGAAVVVTGDAREGDWKTLNAALRAAGVKDIVVHEPPPAGSASR